MSIKLINTTVDTVYDNLLKICIKQNTFLPNIWAEFAATTNSFESSHAKLNASLSAAYPNIFSFNRIFTWNSD
jgi:hypothetical protein